MTTAPTPLERADRAVRDAWGNRHHTTSDGSMFYAPPVRDDGATDALIRLAVPTAVRAVLDRDELARVLARMDGWRWDDTEAPDFDEYVPGELRPIYLSRADALIAHLTGGAA